MAHHRITRLKGECTVRGVTGQTIPRQRDDDIPHAPTPAIRAGTSSSEIRGGVTDRVSAGVELHLSPQEIQQLGQEHSKLQ